MINAVVLPDALVDLEDSDDAIARADLRTEIASLFLVIEQLPQSLREVLWLASVEELSNNQIAEKMGLHRQTVSRRLAKARALLRDAQQPHSGFP